MTQIHNYPVVYIQSDWNESLRLPNSEAWISVKYRNQPGTHGKITSSVTADNKVKFSICSEFTVLSHTSNMVVVKHSESELVTAFVVPMKSYKVHNKAIHSVSAAENALVASSSEDDKIIVWDSRTGNENLVLQGHGGPAYKCKFFPSGTVVLTAGADGSLKVWSAETGVNPVTLAGHSMAVMDSAIIDRGRNIISVSKDGMVKLWDVGEAKCLSNILSTNSVINCCCVVSTPNEQTVKNPREVATGDKLVIVGCENGSVQCAHIAMREVLFIIAMDSPVNCCATLGNNILLGCENGKIVLVSSQNGSILQEWWESGSPVLSLEGVSSCKFLSGRQDGACVLQSLDHPAVRVQLTGSDCDPIRGISFNGRWVFTGCRDCCIRKYDFNQLAVHFK